MPQNSNHHQKQAHRRQREEKQHTPADVSELHKSSDQHPYLLLGGASVNESMERIVAGRFQTENRPFVRGPKVLVVRTEAAVYFLRLRAVALALRGPLAIS